MTKQELLDLKIQKPDMEIYKEVKGIWDAKSKPIDGFGDFEDAICQIAAIQRTLHPSIQRRGAVILIGDHGVVAEGVSQSSQEVTAQVADNLGEGISTVSVLGKGAATDIIPVDFGIATEDRIPGVRDCKVAKGTRNFRREPAMTEEETLTCIQRGISLVKSLKEEGYEILATGEMGIGNTTSATALLCALLHLDPEVVTGRGAGLDDAGLQRKRQVIQESIEKQGAGDAWQMLCALGGLEIAGLVGVYLGGALYQLPIVMDGLISGVAAYLAECFVPGAKEFQLASHEGREGGLAYLLNAIGKKPYLKGDMALGEGTGAVLLFPLLDTILYYYECGSSFQKTQIDAYARFDA